MRTLSFSNVLTRTLRVTLMGAVMMTLVPKGATGGLPLFTACMVAGATFLGAARRPPTGQAGHLYGQGLLICLAVAILAACQAVSIPDNPFAHPVWVELRDGLGGEASTKASISIAPGATLIASLSVLLPLIVFLAGVALFDTDRAALALWRFAAGVGFLFAVLGIVELQIAPDRFLFLLPKEYYVGSLTSLLVNRNTAGTLLGVACLTLAALILARRLPGERRTHEATGRARLVMLVAAYGTTLVGLFLTRSRGALLATLIAHALFAILLVRTDVLTEGRRKLALIAACLAALVLVVLAFGAQTIWRMEVQGVDPERLCVYRSTWRAFQDNWIFGTGLGTFTDVFPAYRDPDCVGVRSLWNRAHNTWLEGLMTMGVVFVPLAAFSVVRLTGVFRTGLRTRRRMRPFAAAGAAVLCLVAVHGMVDFSLQIPGLAVYVAIVLAAATTLCLQRA
ncbi:hypothetical protein GGQ76_002476 [Aureimonas jatrophae]|uniref:O-antigen ligase n=2 Tax=Aureimonas jatrophae TaxID=1166073 RepID=A0A1H0NCC6_9HYPH|nr:O-antigen ligase family protein [Aureimonas jatrophae]MBB3951178.1 hypothetical protein [Aureimonas jatrophae]SDO90424.1 O-antigen ligase [Aureimonas jatrophae]